MAAAAAVVVVLVVVGVVVVEKEQREEEEVVGDIDHEFILDLSLSLFSRAKSFFVIFRLLLRMPPFGCKTALLYLCGGGR